MRAPDRLSASESQPKTEEPDGEGGTARRERDSWGPPRAASAGGCGDKCDAEGREKASLWREINFGTVFGATDHVSVLGARLHHAVGKTLAITKVMTAMESDIYDYQFTVNATLWCSRLEMAHLHSS